MVNRRSSAALGGRRLAVALGWMALLASGCDDGGGSAEVAREGEVDVGVDAGPEPDAAAPAFQCTGSVQQAYDPVGDPATITSFPDDFWTAPDSTRETGLRVAIPAETPWVAGLDPRFRAVYAEMNALDGFGTSAPVILSFDGPIGALNGMAAGLDLYDLGSDVPVAVPYEPVVLDEGHTLALWPAFPLRPGTRHAVVAHDAFKAGDGACVRQSPVITALLAGDAPDPALAPLVPRVAEVLALTGISADQVQALSVFTTQTIHTGEDASVRVAADVDARQYTFVEPPSCTIEGAQRHCEGKFVAHDYRNAEGRVTSDQPDHTYVMPFSAWLPANGEGPWVTYVLAHGLGGDRSLGQYVAQLTGEGPVAVVAIDAVAHGEHPGGAPTNQLDLLAQFFAFNLGTRLLDVPRLRDNFRQSTFDKLQLLRLIRQNPDLDGDGNADVDVDRLGYFGISLGGIMGAEYLALNDATRNAVLGVPGARLSRIIRDSPSFELILNIYLPNNFSDGFKERMYGAVQTVVERGDPVNFAGHILKDRLAPGGDVVPDVLLVMAINDQIVPNSATAALARALQIPLVAPVVRPLDFLPSADVVPARANIGGHTAGMAQYKEISQLDRTGRVRRETATHENVMLGRETIVQVKSFFESFATDGVAIIVDPYAEL